MSIAPSFTPHVTPQNEFCVESRPDPCGLVIFGASGDLTARKLIPAVYNLYHRRLTSRRFYVVGFARSAMDDEGFRKHVHEALTRFVPDATSDQIELFKQICHYVSGNYDDMRFYEDLSARLAELDLQHETGPNHVFYLATPPSLYASVVGRLGQAGLVDENPGRGYFARVIIEKPFGHDLNSALELGRKLHHILDEKQLYRIDHYLGKETVQNIMMFRFANSIFEPVWNSRYIDHVKITAAESIGVGNRAGYFEQAGVLRDMFQNHMMQMLSLVAMEPPATFQADRVRDEKVKLLRSTRPFDLEHLDEQVIRAQYTQGTVNGEKVNGYRQENGVAGDSMIETYVATKMMIDNWRWKGVPFYLRSGKRLGRRYSEIAVVFKQVPHSIFRPIHSNDMTPNILVFSVQPREGISLTMMAKHPGPKLCMSALNLDFNYEDVFNEESGDAYERLLLDGMLGDQTLFIRQDDMEVAWELFTPVLNQWAGRGRNGKLHFYEPGSWGPKAAVDLLYQDHQRRWTNPVST
jgi:glucose-6-phosphate 1-dehydrogenase